MKKSGVYKSITMAAVISAFTLTYAASAANIGFVVGASNGSLDQPFDIGWAARLTLQGNTVTTIVENTPLSNPVYAAQDLFIISSDVASGTVLANMGLNLAKPYIAYEYGVWDDFYQTGAANGTSSGSANDITILLPGNPLAAGLSGTVSIYTGTGGGPRVTGPLSAGTQVVGQCATNAAWLNLIDLEPGALGGAAQGIAPALRIAVPCYADWNPALVTADGWRIFDGAVAYALIPEPSSFGLIGLGLVALVARRRSR